MNSYLHNLTMRTLNSGNLIEPRLPSLFEERKFRDGLPSLESETPIEPHEEDVEVVSNPPLNQSTVHKSPLPGQLEKKLTLEDEDLVASDDHESVSIDKRAERLSPEDGRRNNIKTVEVPEDDPFLKVGEESYLENSSPSPESPLSPSSPNQSQTKALTSHSSPKRSLESRPTVLIPTLSTEHEFQEQIGFEKTSQSIATNRIEPSDGAEKTERRDQEESEDSNPTKSYRRLTPTLATWRDPREQPAHRGRRQSFGPIESEPSINVTIGRVEVRATPADNRKTTSKPRSESPVMPLEDYLRKQRRGGER